jgi:Gpi18-like mannosyltransferase
MTGLVYAGLHAVSGSFLLYNLALKLPVIAADVGLAYLVAAVLRQRGASPAVCRWAWTFLLLNPFLLYVGAAWGEIDAIVALLAVAALWVLGAPPGRWRLEGSALLLALAICFKPTALPLLAAAVLWLAGASLLRAARYGAVCAAGVALFYLGPFFVFGWSRAPFTEQLNAHPPTSCCRARSRS